MFNPIHFGFVTVYSPAAFSAEVPIAVERRNMRKWRGVGVGVWGVGVWVARRTSLLGPQQSALNERGHKGVRGKGRARESSGGGMSPLLRLSRHLPLCFLGEGISMFVFATPRAIPRW